MNGNFKTCLYGFLIVFGTSCKMETMLLGNRKTEVPKGDKAYKNRQYFDKSLLQSLDTNAIYRELNSSPGWFGVYRFYSNGNMNFFYFKGNNVPDKMFFNPGYGGYRGVYYKDGNKIKGDLFAEVNQVGHIGKIDKEFYISGDTLFVVSTNKTLKNRKTYIKRKLPPEYFGYRANW